MTNNDSKYTDEFWKSSDFPWKDTFWIGPQVEILDKLAPRPSSTRLGLVAYYQTPEKRAEGILTPIKAGRFLKKYFSECYERYSTGSIPNEVIQQEALKWSNSFDPQKLTITQDSDEIEAVYKSNKLGSCMWFGDDDYSGCCHPARVYGGNLDLGIAYIGTRDDCAARCLVWPEKKIYYYKMYGDKDRLRAALHAAGYQKGDESDFEGARLLCIEDHHANYVMPYLDVIGYVDLNEAEGVFTITEHGEYQARETNGLLGERKTLCDHCEEPTDEDDLTWVEGIQGHVCSHCLEQHYFQCEIMREYYHNDERVDTEDHWQVSREGMERSGEFYWCEWTELYLHESDHTVVETSKGEHVNLSLLEDEDYWHCDATQLWYSSYEDCVDHAFIYQPSIVRFKVSRGWINNNPDEYQEFLVRHGITPIDGDAADGDADDQLEMELAEAA